MAEVTWLIELDADGDGSYAVDLGGDMIEATWEVGSQPYQPIAMPSRMSITLRNLEGRYSPQHANALSGFTRGRRVRIRSRYGADVRTHCIMRITNIKPDWGQYGRRRTVIEGEGWLSDAQRQDRINVAVQTGKRADQLIVAAVDAAGFYPPAYDGTSSSWRDLEEGQSTFPYAFDNVRESDTLYNLLRIVAESEGWPARIYETREGKLRFLDRHYAVAVTDSVATFEHDLLDLDYSFGATVYNRITVNYTPRRLETSGPYTLHTTANAIQVRRGQTETVTLHYEDGSGNPVSTTDPIDPVSGTDWEANSSEDGSGTDLTSSFTVTATHYGNGSTWSITNSGSRDGYLLAGATQRANNRLTDYGRQTVTVEDTSSQAAYGLYHKTIDAGLLASTLEANDMAEFILSAFSTPRGESRRVVIAPYASDWLLYQALERTVADRITIVDAQTGEEADYMIVGERHSVRMAGHSYRCEWLLEPTGSMDTFWMLGTSGRSELGQATVLGY